MFGHGGVDGRFDDRGMGDRVGRRVTCPGGIGRGGILVMLEEIFDIFEYVTDDFECFVD